MDPILDIFETLFYAWITLCGIAVAVVVIALAKLWKTLDEEAWREEWEKYEAGIKFNEELYGNEEEDSNEER